MQPTHPYVQVSLSFAIPPSRDISTPLQKLIAPFKKYIWLLIILMLVFGSIIILFTKALTRTHRHFIIGGRMNRTPVLNMLNIFLGGVVANPYLKKIRSFGTFARTLLMTWIIGCLILRSAYQGALYDFLRRELLSSQLDTIQKIFASKCDIHLMYTASSSLDLYKLNKKRYRTYTKNQQLVFRELRDRKIDGVVYANEYQVTYFNILNSKKGTISYTKDRLFLMPVVMFFPKYSSLPYFINKELLFYAEYGLIKHWTREYTDKRFISVKYDRKRPKKLKIANIIGIINVCCVLIIISCIVFIMELFAQKFEKIRKIIEILTY